MALSIPAIEAGALPEHDKTSLTVQLIEGLSIFVACSLIVLHLIRFSKQPQLLNWPTKFVVLLAFPIADFVSGLVHWSADTWGSEQWPVIGKRFLRPFRLHHINPDDFLRRNFVDTNGDVAMFCMPVLLWAWFIPLTSAGGRLSAVFLVSFCFWSLPTNQIHQWAHMPNPPYLVKILQRCKLILGAQHHMGHHHAPFSQNYCIINGWCNGVLARLSFFPVVEGWISILTGLIPRAEEQGIPRSVSSSKATGEAAQ